MRKRVNEWGGEREGVREGDNEKVRGRISGKESQRGK